MVKKTVLITDIEDLEQLNDIRYQEIRDSSNSIKVFVPGISFDDCFELMHRLKRLEFVYIESSGRELLFKYFMAKENNEYVQVKQDTFELSRKQYNDFFSEINIDFPFYIFSYLFKNIRKIRKGQK